MRAAIFATVCALAAAASETTENTRLVAVKLTDEQDFSAVQRLLSDKEQWESLTEKQLVAFATPTEVEALLSSGLNVKLDVPNESQINALEAQKQELLYNLTKGSSPDWTQYCNHDCMTVLLRDLTDRCPEIFRLESIGSSVRGRALWVLRASLRPTDDVPQVLMAGNIHGDEVTGGQLLQRLAWDFCDKYRTDTRINTILTNTVLYFMPMFNPDGYHNRNRANANGRDLNRDFPNTWTSPNDVPTGRQPETQAYLTWTRSKNIRLSLMMHGGALCVNYPYDSRRQGTTGYSATDRDALVVQLSRAYSFAHTSMWRSTQFRDGIVNGAVWYIIYGSAQDFQYDYRGVIDLTIEVSGVKWPAGSQLPAFYDANYNAMLTFCESVRLVIASSGGM